MFDTIIRIKWTILFQQCNRISKRQVLKILPVPIVPALSAEHNWRYTDSALWDSLRYGSQAQKG